MRRFGRRGGESITNAPERRPLLETAIRSGFVLLAEDPGREVVVGVVMGQPMPEWALPRRSPQHFKQFDAPNSAKITMNFRVEPAGDGACQVLTETRVYASDPWARRVFAGYWRVIYPGSALIRRMWLRAIQRRAEGITSPL